MVVFFGIIFRIFTFYFQEKYNLIELNEIFLSAIEATMKASKVIIDYYQFDIDVDIKADGSPVTKADLASSKIIFDILSKTGIPILGEELKKKEFSIRSQWEKNWCVDPLDGTKMFLQKNDEFVVSIALIENHQPIFGVLASPVQERIIIGIKGKGVYIFNFKDFKHPEKWRKITPSKKRNYPLTVACSRSFSRLNEDYAQIIEDEYGSFEYLKMGSALKFFELAEGKADMYVRFGPTMEWDIAAGQAILEELGGEVRSFDTNEILSYNKKSLFNPPFIAKTNVLINQ